MENLKDRRLKAANKAFRNHKFDNAVAEYFGWSGHDPDEYIKTVMFKNAAAPNEDPVVGHFSVVFHEDSDEIIAAFDRCDALGIDKEKHALPDLVELRIGVANRVFDDFLFVENVIDSNGWEADGSDELVRTVFFENTENPSGDSIKGHFVVRFDQDSTYVMGAHGHINEPPSFRV